MRYCVLVVGCWLVVRSLLFDCCCFLCGDYCSVWHVACGLFLVVFCLLVVCCCFWCCLFALCCLVFVSRCFMSFRVVRRLLRVVRRSFFIVFVAWCIDSLSILCVVCCPVISVWCSVCVSCVCCSLLFIVCCALCVDSWLSCVGCGLLCNK